MGPAAVVAAGASAAEREGIELLDTEAAAPPLLPRLAMLTKSCEQMRGVSRREGGASAHRAEAAVRKKPFGLLADYTQMPLAQEPMDTGECTGAAPAICNW